MASPVYSGDTRDSIPRLIESIRALPSDAPVQVGTTGYNQYTTQKAHWLGWLGHTPGTGSYERRTPSGRGARYVYNHIVEPKMLLWLIEAAGVDRALVDAAKQASLQPPTRGGKSKAIRQRVPFPTVAEKLWSA